MANTRSQKSYRTRGPHSGGGLRVLLSFLAVLVMAGCILWACILFFQIKQVEIIGETRYTDREIMEAGGITPGMNMFLYNKFKSIDGILVGCPYIDEIVVRRSLPDTIRIQVTEATPVCQVAFDEIIKARDQFGQVVDWPLPTVYYLLDLQQKILEKREQPDGTLPMLKGVTLTKPQVGKTAVFSDEQKGKQAFTLLNTGKNNDILDYIQWVDVSKSYALKVQYTDRFAVNFGTIDDLDRKCRFMLAIVEQLEPSDVGTIDVSDTTTARFEKRKES